ncbi:MAG: hypothetical protein Q8P31_10990, partial [Bacillota bacterium]|nr:hypothetical protein [Bacillota bacterium]
STAGQPGKRQPIGLVAWSFTAGTRPDRKTTRMSADQLVAHIQAETGINIRTMALGTSATFTLKNKTWTVQKVAE